MVERIRMLLEARQLTPTQFADAIGVARPIVSHILSGRNKPSLEVVQRILAAMPDLSMSWLLNGTGPMQAAAASTMPVREPQPAEALQKTPPVPEKEEVALPITSTPTAGTPAARPAPPPAPAPRGRKDAPIHKALSEKALSAHSGPKRFAPPTPKPGIKPGAEPPILLSQPPVTAPPVTSDVPSPPQNQADNAAGPGGGAPVVPADSTAAALFAGTEKPIRRIVIFYKDGSFADYHPE